MPSFNVTISNSSPLVQYSGSWIDTPKTDNDWTQYLNDTYHVTNGSWATATLQFNGSAVYIFGARKPGYGAYLVTLDGGIPFQADPPSTATKEFDFLLYNATSLDVTREHQINLVNPAGSSQGYLDLDYMIITAGDGYAPTISNDVTWSENNTNISYSTGWGQFENVNYAGGTAQYTYTQGAFATVNFDGDAIALYGTVNDDHGLFGVSIDGGPQSNFNGFAPEPRFVTLLYYASGLAGGRHILKLTDVSPAGNGQLTNGLDFDQVVVSSWPHHPPSPQSSGAPTNKSDNTQTYTSDRISNPASSSMTFARETTSSSPPTRKHISTGAVIGVVIVVVAAAAILLSLVRWRAPRNRRELVEKSHPSPFMVSSEGNLRGTNVANEIPTIRPSSNYSFPKARAAPERLSSHQEHGRR